MGAVYSSLDLVCCGPAGKGLLEIMPDLSLSNMLGVTEGPGAKEPSKLVQWVEVGGQEGRQKTHLELWLWLKPLCAPFSLRSL